MRARVALAVLAALAALCQGAEPGEAAALRGSSGSRVSELLNASAEDGVHGVQRFDGVDGVDGFDGGLADSTGPTGPTGLNNTPDVSGFAQWAATTLRLGRRPQAFEPWVSRLGRPLSSGVLDLRVAKGMRSRGYGAVRVSVITLGAVPPASLRTSSDVNFTYSAPFQYRWTHAFDLGTLHRRCSAASVLSSHEVGSDAECLHLCSAAPSCAFYSLFEAAIGPSRCELAGQECALEEDALATATYANLGRVWLHSGVAKLRAGRNVLRVGGEAVSIELPAEGAGTAGIVWSDPCFSGRWVNCAMSESWDLFQESHAMLNAVAEDPSVHFIQVLGDNLYDQDGRLTHALWSRLGRSVKSKFLMTTIGNHDMWVGGSPPGDRWDQRGYGFMQFYAQDSLAALGAPGRGQGFADLSLDPDNLTEPVHNHVDNRNANFLWYYTLGNLGFIGYNGAATREETLPELRKACRSFLEPDGAAAPWARRRRPRFVFLLGHWNHDGDGADPGMDVPAIYRELRQMPGCDIGDRLKFFDGHAHCNYVQEQGSREPVGFMVGGRGMIDETCLPQSGFTFIDSATDNKLRVYHFAEHTIAKSTHRAVYDCVRLNRGNVRNCLQHAALWLETDLHSDDEDDELDTNAASDFM